MAKNVFIGVNITSNELVEQSFQDGSLPRNYEVRTYIGTAAFEKALRMTKRRVLKVFDIQGLNEKLNPYFDMKSQTNIPLPKDTVFTVLLFKSPQKPRLYYDHTNPFSS
jgi:hypothetical protein